MQGSCRAEALAGCGQPAQGTRLEGALAQPVESLDSKGGGNRRKCLEMQQQEELWRCSLSQQQKVLALIVLIQNISVAQLSIIGYHG